MGGDDSGDKEEPGAGTLWGARGGGHMERRCLAWDRAVGRDSVTDGRWRKRIQDEAQVPVTGARVGVGAVPEIGEGVGFIYSFFMHSFIKKKKKKKKDVEPLLCARQCSRLGVYISEQNRYS